MAPERAPSSSESILSPSQNKHALLKEISGKWGKFSEAELADLKNNDELATQISMKYSLELAAVQTDVNAFMNGRRI